MYEQLVPTMFYCEVSAATRERIMNVVNEMVKEYTAMYNQWVMVIEMMCSYATVPFSLHHRSRYLLHAPEEVASEVQSLYSHWGVCWIVYSLENGYETNHVTQYIEMIFVRFHSLIFNGKMNEGAWSIWEAIWEATQETIQETIQETTQITI